MESSITIKFALLRIAPPHLCIYLFITIKCVLMELATMSGTAQLKKAIVLYLPDTIFEILYRLLLSNRQTKRFSEEPVWLRIRSADKNAPVILTD